VTTLHPITRAAAIHGLDIAAPPSGAREPDADEWDHIKLEVGAHGLVGLLAAAYEDGAVKLTDPQADDVADFQVTAATVAVEIESAVLEMLELIESHDVPVRMLKGVASAHLDYPDPSWRTFNDADLLVRGSDIDRLVAVLASAGHERELPERRAGFDRRFGKDITVYGPNQVQLDLHRTFAVGVYGLRQRVDDLWLDSTPFVLGGRTVHALVAEDRLLHACFAAVFGGRHPRVALLRDIAQLLARYDLDADLVMRRSHRWRCVPVVTAAVHAAFEALGALPASPVVDWATAQPTRRRDRALLRAYPIFGGSHPLASLSGIVAAGGLRDTLAYLGGLFRPDAEYRRARATAGRRPEWRLLVEGMRRTGKSRR
jgi:Uncharacterised nucleotidyltransferase